MTLRVITVHADGSREVGRRREVKVTPDPTRLREGACRYPPCACPHHRPDLHQGAAAVRAMRTLEECTRARTMAELWAWRRL